MIRRVLTARKLEAEKWRYVYAKLRTFYDAMIEHFAKGPATLGAGSATGVDREVIKALLFGQLQPFGNPSSASEVQLPNRVWRDLLLPRGTGLEVKFYEFKYDFSLSDNTLPSDDPDEADLQGTRRDADLYYTEKDKHLGTNKEDGLPRGWKQNTPWPLLLPSDHVFVSKGNPKSWRGRWAGRLFLPKAWAGQKVWLAFNLEPLNDNGFRVSVRPANSANWQVINDWKKDPPHKLVTAALATNEAGFYDIVVQFYDVSKATDAFDAKFALCAAVTPAGTVAAPAKDKFDPIPGALFYFTDAGVVAGKTEFDKGYQRAWKAVYYAHALRLIAPEIDYFSDDRTRFQGIYPTYPASAALLGTQPFNLNDLYELPVDDRKRAFLDQWEHLRDYTSLRDLPGTARPARFAQFKAVFDLSPQAGDADPAVAVQPISIALFDSAAQTDLVKECLSYWDGYSLPNAVLKNEVWLRRIQPFVHLLQHASVWMQAAASRFTGDLVRLTVADPLVPARLETASRRSSSRDTPRATAGIWNWSMACACAAVQHCSPFSRFVERAGRMANRTPADWSTSGPVCCSSTWNARQRTAFHESSRRSCPASASSMRSKWRILPRRMRGSRNGAESRPMLPGTRRLTSCCTRRTMSTSGRHSPSPRRSGCWKRASGATS
ncbi:hypothetical protein ACVWXO_000420 [Bradyrhizobium sp. LM2.7]